MTDGYRALCSDFYINLKLALKMDLPRDRQTTLDLFDRVRREYPAMSQFRRYKDELALETDAAATPHRWLAIRGNTVRAGAVNPEPVDDGYAFHHHVLEVAPFYLGVTTLDVDHVELLYGFDLAADGNHDEIVYRALVAGSPLGRMGEIPGTVTIDCQPVLGVSLREPGDYEAQFEIKTRAGRGARSFEARGEPISVYLSVRKYGPPRDIRDLAAVARSLADRGEDLAESHVVPNLVNPIRGAIEQGGMPS